MTGRMEIRDLTELLADAARRSNMPAGEQLRFESALGQLGGRIPREEPLPLPSRRSTG